MGAGANQRIAAADTFYVSARGRSVGGAVIRVLLIVVFGSVVQFVALSRLHRVVLRRPRARPVMWAVGFGLVFVVEFAALAAGDGDLRAGLAAGLAVGAIAAWWFVLTDIRLRELSLPQPLSSVPRPQRRRIVRAVHRGERVPDPEYAELAAGVAAELLRRQRRGRFSKWVLRILAVSWTINLVRGIAMDVDWYRLVPHVAVVAIAIWSEWKLPRLAANARRAHELNSAVAEH